MLLGTIKYWFLVGHHFDICYFFNTSVNIRIILFVVRSYHTRRFTNIVTVDISDLKLHNTMYIGMYTVTSKPMAAIRSKET